MRIVVFLNCLALGGTEKAACRWACGLRDRGHQISLIALQDGPRRAEVEQHQLPLQLIAPIPAALARSLEALAPDILHVHAPGTAHSGDVLGEALALLPKKIPVVQTNIFGRLDNDKEDAWTDFRLFISWTSCVQAGRRAFQPLDKAFFRQASVAVYPVDPVSMPAPESVAAFRQRHGIQAGDLVFGRFSRPEPNKWTSLALDAFRLALKRNAAIKLLLREPPPKIAEQLRNSPDADRFIILPATADSKELVLTMAAVDVVLHTSSIGESFGYGIAEPMNLGKPVITHSLPWGDQAQIELVRHGECGFIASTPQTMAEDICKLAADAGLREQTGNRARNHIRLLADPDTSISRLERVVEAVLAGKTNPFLEHDLAKASETAAYLDQHQFGHTWVEQVALRPFHYRVRFHQWRKFLRGLFRQI